MTLTSDVKTFIERKIELLRNNDIHNLIFESAYYLTESNQVRLLSVLNELGIETKSYLPDVFKRILRNMTCLNSSNRVSVTKIIDQLPRFNIPVSEFRSFIVQLIKEVYPNKTLSPDNFGIECIVDKEN